MRFEPLPAMPDKILVYRYTYWDEASQQRKTSSLYATVEVIRNGLGTPVYTTALEVERRLLRDGGIYVPEQRSSTG